MRPVGDPHQRDLRGAERLAQRLEVEHGVGGRVERAPRPDLRRAARDGRGQERVEVAQGLHLRAAQHAGLAGAALVERDEAVLAQGGREARRRRRREVDARLSRPAGQGEQDLPRARERGAGREMQRNRPRHDARVVERDVQRPAAEVRLTGAPREARRGLRAGCRCERQERRERDGQEREREQRSGDGAMAGARAEHRSANRPCMRRIWRLAGPIVNASRTRRPLNWTLRFSAILKDMSTGERHLYGRNREAEQLALQREWRRLTRAATFVAVLTSPVTFAFFYVQHDWPLLWALVGTFVFIIAFRGFLDVLAHRLIPRASMYGAGRELVEEDIVSRRRVWYWRRSSATSSGSRSSSASRSPSCRSSGCRSTTSRASSSPRCRCCSSTASSCRCCSSATC